MKRLMRYKIISGRVVEKRDVLMEASLDPESRRARPRGKRRGRSAAAQIERNGREAVRRLARLLNCNFRGGDLFLTLKYSDGRLPEDRAAAEQAARRFVRSLSGAYLRATGRKLRWVLVTAHLSARTGAEVRVHHHLVMDAVAWELIARYWPDAEFSYRRLDNGGDYTAVARYMVRNAGYERGRRTWSSCQGLLKPVFTPPEPVAELGSWRVPKEAQVAEREVREDGEAGFWAGYIRYVMPEEKRELRRIGELGPERLRSRWERSDLTDAAYPLRVWRGEGLKARTPARDGGKATRPKGAPARAQRSGSCGERTSSGTTELSRLRGSKGCAACEDAARRDRAKRGGGEITERGKACAQACARAGTSKGKEKNAPEKGARGGG